MKIETMFKKLPYEAQQQIESTMNDDGKTFNDIDIQFLKTEVEWTIERRQMDIEDGDDVKSCKSDIRKCQNWIKKYCQ